MQSDIDIGIIQFPGSNTERETIMACNRVGMNPIEFLWNEDPKNLSNLAKISLNSQVFSCLGSKNQKYM